MSQTEPSQPFLLIIVDQDLRAFNLVEPKGDDTDWNRRVSEAREKGRNVRIDELPLMTMSRDEMIDAIRKRLNCEHTEVSLV